MKTILIIEDDKSVAQMLQDVLEAEGFAVLVERDGEWGLRAATEKPIDLLLVDVLIPKIKGFDLLARLRDTEKGKKLPVIVISGVYRSAMHKERITERHGIVEYLDKPIDVDHLIDVLHDVFSSAYPAPENAEPKVSGESPMLSVSAVRPEALPRAASLPPAPPDLTLRGELGEVPFARLIGRLFAVKASGALLLRKGSVKKIVYLRQGIPVFVKSNLLNECLGRVMVAERLITQEQCDLSLIRKREHNKKQGDMLVEMGCISPHNLEFALELQMQTKLWDIFSWLEGKFQFSSKEEYDGPSVALSMPPTAMIYEGASHAMSPERVRRELARIAEARVLPPRDPTFRYQALELDPRATRLLDRIDGRRTVGGLLEEPGFDGDDAAILVYALTCTSLMQLQGAPPDIVPLPPLPPMPEPAPASAEPEQEPLPEPAAEADDEVPIVLEEADVEALSTGEINPLAELSKVLPSSVVSDLLSAAPPPQGSSLRSLIFEHTPRPEGSARLDAREFEPPAPEPARPLQSFDASWGSYLPDPEAKERAPLPVAPPPPPPEVDPPAMSADLRRQIRARLDAEVSRLAAERNKQPRAGAPAQTQEVRLDATLVDRPLGDNRPQVVRKMVARSAATSPRIAAPKLDLEREAARTRELEHRLSQLKRQSYYELLAVNRRAGLEEITAAFARAAAENHPDKIVPGTTSRENRALAEAIYLLYAHAQGVLADLDARLLYDRELELELEELRIATPMRGERAYQRGQQAAQAGEWARAREHFHEATQLVPQEGLYWAHLGRAVFLSGAKDAELQQEALACFERAVECSPRAEEIYLLRGLLYQKTGNRAEATRDYEQALRCNPDCVTALQALRVLEPPQQKKTGLLSRLNLS